MHAAEFFRRWSLLSTSVMRWLSGNQRFPLSHDNCRQPQTYVNQRLQLQFLSSWWWAVCRPKHVEQLRNIGIIKSTTWLHLVGYFYKIYIAVRGSMNIKLPRKLLVSNDSVWAKRYVRSQLKLFWILRKFEFLIAASIWIHISDYCAMNMRSVRFSETSIRSVRFSETSITIYQFTRCKITGNSNLCFCSCLPIYMAMQCKPPNESSSHFIAVLSLFS